MKKLKIRALSLSDAMTLAVVTLTFTAVIIALIIFNSLFRDYTKRAAVTNTEQSVDQVSVTMNNYTEDMIRLMDSLYENGVEEPQSQEEFLEDLIAIRNDIVMISTYDSEGNNTGIWSNYEVKSPLFTNLSYNAMIQDSDIGGINISAPHVVSVLDNYYPWVVTISSTLEGAPEDYSRIAIDFRFSDIAGYIDEVGIGQHGYCFIMDGNGNIIYHPQQQLIHVGIKSENEIIGQLSDGSHQSDGVIYTVKTLHDINWKIIGVTFLDETVNSSVNTMIFISVLILLAVVLLSFLSGSLFSYLFTKPIQKLTDAMHDFENNAQDFVFEPITGAYEVNNLSDSFEHLVKRIQQLMEEVKNEENTLRKTQLKALQAQINPHFLYNTLDSISWMCEEGKTQDAVLMVNDLAKLFRISISGGHEIIPIEKELQHAECYLRIQKYRYKNQFDYRFEVEESCKKYLCNKITLQPMIENALIHGLNMIDEGHIIIRLYEKEDDIIMEVEDNGVGMVQEQIDSLFRTDIADHGIGVKNVNDRVKIYFGDEYGITVKPEPDVGTTVTVKIPKATEDGKYEK